jgi:hypothetical protein
MLELIDELLNVIEPGGVMDATTGLRTSTSGTTVHHTGARPFQTEFAPDSVFAWLTADRHGTFEVGNPPSVREDFVVTVLFVAESGEQAREVPSRAVSTVVDAKAHAYLERIAANQSRVGFWQDIGGEINAESMRGFDVRGAGLRVSGWRYLWP